MISDALLLSIHPEYAEMIFNGDKTVELRKVKPKIKNGDLVIIYVTSPVKELAGVLKVDKVIEEDLEELWNKVKKKCGITKKEFDNYFKNKNIGYGISFKDVWKFSNPTKLNSLRNKCPGFRPPQGYHYVDLSKEEKVLNNLFLNILKTESMVFA
jgi:predicted transcriptional regulator